MKTFALALLAIGALALSAEEEANMTPEQLREQRVKDDAAALNANKALFYDGKKVSETNT